MVMGMWLLLWVIDLVCVDSFSVVVVLGLGQVDDIILGVLVKLSDFSFVLIINLFFKIVFKRVFVCVVVSD